MKLSTFITGLTEDIMPADDDLIMVYDADGAALKKVQKSNLIPAGGGDLVNPMTTAGDIIIGVSAGSPARLGIGAEGQVLTVVNGMPAWADAPTGTGGEAFATIDPEIQQEFSETFSDSGVPTS